MGTPFLSEIKLISFNFAPRGWAMCNGQVLQINTNQALFSLLGTTYGGNGQTTFALPNLQGRVAMHMGNGHVLGELGGEERHTLMQNEMAAHVHLAQATSSAGDKTNPASSIPAGSAPDQIYSPGGGAMTGVPMNPAMVANAGGSQPHDNMQPYLVLNYIIALQGVFPSRN